MRLAIAEQFYSIQGEGRFAGKPAHFLRLAGCNLLCGGVGTDKDKQLHGGATWRCDTIEVWRKGRAVEIEDLIQQWRHDGTLSNIRQGAHLVITGGEPLLQQNALNEFLAQLGREIAKDYIPTRFIEIETNGTIVSQLDECLIVSYNVSPKLANSGMPLELRKVKLGSWMMDLKFVIERKDDIDEVLQIIDETDIDHSRVYLMPATEDRPTLIERSLLVAELCMVHKFNFSSRHQVMIWDRTTGV